MKDYNDLKKAMYNQLCKNRKVKDNSQYFGITDKEIISYFPYLIVIKEKDPVIASEPIKEESKSKEKEKSRKL